MDKHSYLSNANPDFFDQMYQQYKTDNSSVDASWQRFFEGFELATKSFEGGEIPEDFQKEFKVINLINGYRTRGHLFTQTNPVRDRRSYTPTLGIENFGLTEDDMNTVFQAGQEVGIGPASLEKIIDHLKRVYCNSIGIEYMHLRQPEEIKWLQEKIHVNDNHPNFSKEEKLNIYDKLNRAVGFETFMHKKFVGQKRFSLEGAESLIPSLDTIIETSSDLGVDEFVIGMAHRGRLNVLANIFGKSFEDIFTEFQGKDYTDPNYEGDVKYHFGYSVDRTTDKNKKIHLSLSPNPSHLEAVAPVVQGISRAKVDRRYDGNYNKLIPIIIHGDGAVAGQGVVYEVIQMAQLDGYTTGGTVHVVINNQVGFTTNYTDARSSVYCTDVAKVTQCPVFHVNGDDVEAVIHASKIAMEYRQKFNKDIFIDLLCYRKYGHNEGDEPRFTQPILYDIISKHPNPRDLYQKELLKTGVLTDKLASDKATQFNDLLEDSLELSKKNDTAKMSSSLEGDWKGLEKSKSGDFDKSPKTGVDKKTLIKLAEKINQVPNDKDFFRKLLKILKDRQKMMSTDTLDWGMAELLAYASLLNEGHTVRLTGQDVERGTFSHRHAVLKMEDSANEYVPLREVIKNENTRFEIYNSLLSEYAVLGFDYGYSLAAPNALTIWEAQFGDFSNGGQIIYDQFISCAEEKWRKMSGIVLLLPHGYEGQGAEHSSARIERYLQLCANDNMQMANCTTPANFFHVLRRQLKRKFRKPLVVFTPKKLLRYPACVSSVNDLAEGSFLEIIDDTLNSNNIDTVAFCSGKVYYDLIEKREESKANNIAIVRLEQLFPLPIKQMEAIKKKYSKAQKWFWVQEEPENMGAWTHILKYARFIPFEYIGRDASASSATGSPARHKATQEKIISQLFENAKVTA